MTESCHNSLRKPEICFISNRPPKLISDTKSKKYIFAGWLKNHFEVNAIFYLTEVGLVTAVGETSKHRACVCSVFPDHMAQAVFKCGWSCYGDMSNVQHTILNNCQISHGPFFQALKCVRVTVVWPYSGGLRLDQRSIKRPHQYEAGVVPKLSWC